MRSLPDVVGRMQISGVTDLGSLLAPHLRNADPVNPLSGLEASAPRRGGHPSVIGRQPHEEPGPRAIAIPLTRAARLPPAGLGEGRELDVPDPPRRLPEAADTRLPAFLVAHDGLYLRKRSLLGVSQTKVDGAEHLSAEKEYVEYVLPKVPVDLMARVVGFFRWVYRERRTEAPSSFSGGAEGFDFCSSRKQQVSMASVSTGSTSRRSRTISASSARSTRTALSVPRASSIDADDEASFDGLHVVVGDFDRRRQTYSAATSMVNGSTFDRTSSSTDPRRLIEPPDDWLRRVAPAAAAMVEGERASPPGRTTPRRRSRPPSEPERATSISTCRPRQGSRPRRSARVSPQLMARPVSGSSPKGGGVDA